MVPIYTRKEIEQAIDIPESIRAIEEGLILGLVHIFGQFLVGCEAPI